MKKIRHSFRLVLTLLCFAVAAHAQTLPFTGQITAAYVNPAGTGWSPLTGAGATGQLAYTPNNRALLYVFNGAGWIPWTGSGGGGGTTNTIASGTATLGTSAIASATCATVVTVTATGVASTDAIAWNPNGSIKAVVGYVPSTSGGLTIATYPTTNAVNFDVCNWTAGSITPGSVTLNWRVTR